MGLRANPTQRQRRLGMELRRLRTAAGLSVGEAAAAAGLGPPHLGHIEAARTAIPEVKLRALAAAYGCQSEPLIEALVAMGQATGRGWWSDFRGPHHSDAARDLAELESLSIAHRSFQWVHIPGLLQTPEYMRTLFVGGNPEASPAAIERFVEFRLQRQQVLTGEAPPRFHAVIHEAALRMQFVGPHIMRRQIEHLVELAKLPNVLIQILPFRAEVHPQFSAPFVIYDHSVAQLSTAYVEHPNTSPFIGEPRELHEFDTEFNKLSEAAFAPVPAVIEPKFYTERDSLGLIQHVLFTL